MATKISNVMPKIQAAKNIVFFSSYTFLEIFGNIIVK
jgi:hypothetical protein